MKNRGTNLTERGAARLLVLTKSAADMFLDHGYEAVSLHRLIASAGGSRRNIYQHFGGKEGVFKQAVTWLTTDLGRPLEELEIRSHEAKTALNLYGRQLLEIVLQPRTLALHRLMIAKVHRFPEVAQAILNVGQNRGADILSGWIADQQSSGILLVNLPTDYLAGQFVNLVVTGPQLKSLVGLVDVPTAQRSNHKTVDRAIALFLAGTLNMKDARNV